MATTPSQNFQPWEKNPRLPENVYPVFYDIYLYPDLNGGIFEGKLTININVTEEREFLLLHGKNLNIQETHLVDNSDQNIPLSNIFYYKKNEFWVIVPKDVINSGLYKFKIKYSGNLTANIVGFYESRYNYKDSNGTESER